LIFEFAWRYGDNFFLPKGYGDNKTFFAKCNFNLGHIYLIKIVGASNIDSQKGI